MIVTTPDGTQYTIRNAYSLGDKVVNDSGMVWFDGDMTPVTPAPTLGTTYGCVMEMGDMRREGVRLVIYGYSIPSQGNIVCDVMVGWREVAREVE